jgi:fatty acid desaturase
MPDSQVPISRADQAAPKAFVAAEAADAHWFREPSRREHWIGGALFAGFGGFFIALFLLQRGWWFRWVVLGLAMVSLLRALTHVRAALRSNADSAETEAP